MLAFFTKLTRKREKVFDYKDWLEVLGPALFSQCLQHLDIISLTKCERVCKAWKNVARGDEVWAPLLKRDFPLSSSQVKSAASTKGQYAWAVMQKKRREEEQRIEEERRKRMKSINAERMVCRMFHPTNGRYNFLPIAPPVPFEEMPDRETLVKILQKDNELRLSKDVQEEYWISDYPTGITLAVQTQAVSEYGYSNPWIIPSALSYYASDKEIMSIPHYVKYNRSRQGKLACGDLIPDLPLTTTQGCATSMRALMEPHASAPVVLVAGSYT